MQYHHVLAKLRRKRLDAGYTQAFIADKLGLSRNFYGKTERGTSAITLIHLLQLCSLLISGVIDHEKVQAALVGIKQQRIVMGYTHEYMGFQLHISATAYDKLERDVSRLRLDEFLKICEILNLSCADLLGLADLS